jgi:hypothetical protein
VMEQVLVVVSDGTSVVVIAGTSVARSCSWNSCNNCNLKGVVPGNLQ